MTTTPELVAHWRTEAISLRAWGAIGEATTLERAAVQLEAAQRETDNELLTLTQAAAVSGFSADHLGREVRAGRIPNAGRPSAPKIRRRDLPLKPRKLQPEHSQATFVGARGRIARAVVSSEPGA